MFHAWCDCLLARTTPTKVHGAALPGTCITTWVHAILVNAKGTQVSRASAWACETAVRDMQLCSLAAALGYLLLVSGPGSTGSQTLTLDEATELAVEYYNRAEALGSRETDGNTGGGAESRSSAQLRAEAISVLSTVADSDPSYVHAPFFLGMIKQRHGDPGKL